MEVIVGVLRTCLTCHRAGIRAGVVGIPRQRGVLAVGPPIIVARSRPRPNHWNVLYSVFAII